MDSQRPQFDDILAMLDLRPLGDDRFEGLSPETDWHRIFGGQVLAQGLVAANRTVDDFDVRPAHSFHSHFLRPGNPDIPILFEVERVRDGRSVAIRQVHAKQNGKDILMMTVSYHVREEGFEHQTQMPDVISPEEAKLDVVMFQEKLKDLPEEVRENVTRRRPIEMRFVTEREMFNPVAAEPKVDVWFRATEAMDLQGDLATHLAVLTYASDMTFMDTCLVPHGTSLVDPKMNGVSLDHSVWFHEPVDVRGVAPVYPRKPLGLSCQRF